MTKGILFLIAGTIVLWPYQMEVRGTSLRFFAIGFLLSLILGGFLLLQGGRWKSLFRKSLIIYLLFAGMHVIGYLFGGNSIWELSHNSYLTEFLVSFFFFLLVIGLIETREAYGRMVLWIVLGTSALAVILLYRHLFVFDVTFLTQFFSEEGFRGLGAFNKNTFAFFLLLFFPFAYSYFTHKRNLLGTLTVLVMGAGIVFVLSRMALCASFLSMALLCLGGFKKRLYIVQLAILSGVILLGCLLFQVGPQHYMVWKNTAIDGIPRDPSEFPLDKSFKGSRWRYVRKALEGFGDKPILGHGLNTFSLDHKQYCVGGDEHCLETRGGGSVFCSLEEEACQAMTGGGTLIRYPGTHNDYALILYELGATGLLLFLGIFWDLLRRLWQARSYINDSIRWVWDGQIASLVAMFFAINFINAYYTIPFLFLLAGGYILAQRASETA